MSKLGTKKARTVLSGRVKSGSGLGAVNGVADRVLMLDEAARCKNNHSGTISP